MRQDYQTFRSNNAEVIAIGPGSNRAFRRFWEQHELPFPGVPDPGGGVLKALGQEFRLLKLGRLPGVIVVGRDGVIRFTHYGTAQWDIPPNSELLALLEGLNQPG